ncbi:MAG: hypothetical protein AAGA70_05215 [Pseudomonadota bacterium]
MFTDLFARRAAHNLPSPPVPVELQSELVSSGPNFTLRRITLAPNQEIAFSRSDMARTWQVLKGFGHADINQCEHVMAPTMSAEIAPGMPAQIENRQSQPLIVLELCSWSASQSTARAA